MQITEQTVEAFLIFASNQLGITPEQALMNSSIIEDIPALLISNPNDKKTFMLVGLNGKALLVDSEFSTITQLMIPVE